MGGNREVFRNNVTSLGVLLCRRSVVSKGQKLCPPLG